MQTTSFRALVTDKTEDGKVSSKVMELEDGLPDGNVTVGVEYAGFNYKDGLALTGKGGIVRTYPHVGGIDFAGRVIESSDRRYHPGQGVLLTGWRIGETHWGGFSTRARVNADWLVPLPKKLSTRDAMILGTAGFTARLAITKLRANGMTPDKGEVLVTGAGGGVGSLAVMFLSKLGYKVVAMTGRKETAEDLTKLGAAGIIGREELSEPSNKVLESARWAGVIDNVGGAILGRVLKQIKPGGGVASVGNAAGAEFPGSVIPFILRGVSIYGIDSVMQSYAARVAAWDQLETLFSSAAYSDWVEEIGLEDLPKAATRILKGGVKGRIIVNPRQAED